jgi:putative methionine-R-sulfoxide reductase with GAF domain
VAIGKYQEMYAKMESLMNLSKYLVQKPSRKSTLSKSSSNTGIYHHYHIYYYDYRRLVIGSIIVAIILLIIYLKAGVLLQNFKTVVQNIQFLINRKNFKYS